MADTSVTDILDCLDKVGMKGSAIGPIPLPVRSGGKGKTALVANFIPVYSRLLYIDFGEPVDCNKTKKIYREFSKLAVSNNVAIEMMQVK